MRLSVTVCYALVSAALMFATYPWLSRRLAPESAPIARGAEYAQVRGCVDCHGTANDRSPDAVDANCSDVNTMAWHPDYAVQCGDVMAYFETVRLRRTLAERIQAGGVNVLSTGEMLARKYYCFQCHGHLGQGGFANAGSLKGYVPGYFGEDFKLLTRNADPVSVRSWIVNGMDATILQEPLTGSIAAFFFERQEVSMPSFKSLPEEEIDILVSYVIALNNFGPMTADSVRSYGNASRSAVEVVSLKQASTSADQPIERHQ